MFCWLHRRVFEMLTEHLQLRSGHFEISHLTVGVFLSDEKSPIKEATRNFNIKELRSRALYERSALSCAIFFFFYMEGIGRSNRLLLPSPFFLLLALSEIIIPSKFHPKPF